MILKSEVKYNGITKVHFEAQGAVTLSRCDDGLTVGDNCNLLDFWGRIEFEVLGLDSGLNLFVRSGKDGELICTHITCKEGITVK